MHVLTIVGARPQFIKAAVVSRELRGREGATETFVHTGQHFDDNMSDVFFREMDLPRPDVHLGIAGGLHGRMTGRMLEALEEVIVERGPDWVLVYGDTNSTLAGALAAVKLHVPIAHVEAGLRSFNRRMPEEINRILTDHAATLLFAPTAVAVANLAREGIDDDRVCRVGDVMLDAMCHYRDRVEREDAARGDDGLLGRLGLATGGYVLATVHRAENTDDADRLAAIMDGLRRVADRMPVVLPLHPRTRAALARTGLEAAARALRVIDPVGYLDMVRLEAGAGVIATDSGGVQKEAFFHRVPCVTLRDETEWVELVDAGANTLVGADADRIAAAVHAVAGTRVDASDLYGDGRSAAAIVDAIEGRSADGRRRPP